MASQPIYQFNAKLLDYEKIWRQFQVPCNITVARLGYILMSMFEMQASHLYCFYVPYELNFKEQLKSRFPENFEEIYERIYGKHDLIKCRRYGVLIEGVMDFREEEDDIIIDASKSKLKNIVTHSGEKMIFNYDFGDNWNIHLMLEDIITDKELPGKALPRVLAGEGYGIVENCGGIPGLEDITKAFKAKKGARYEEYCKWLGRDNLNMEIFDIDDANLRVKKIPRIYTDIYEHGLSPTQRSIDFLERKYIK